MPVPWVAPVSDVRITDFSRRRAPSAFYRSADDISALSPFWKKNIERWLIELKNSELRSDVLETAVERTVLEQQLARAAEYIDDWDSYGAPAPESNTVTATERLLRKAFSLRRMPSSVVASAEGGIATYFFKNDKSAYIEYRNSGGAVVVMYDRDSDPIVNEIDQREQAAEAALRTIGEYFA